MRFLRPLVVLIVTALTACDNNIEWGGTEVAVVAPPPASGMERVEADAQESIDLGLPRGSVLFHVTRSAGGATIVPVAEVSGDSLRTIRRPAEVSPQAFESRFRQAVLEPGSQLTLFRRGAEVGTVTVQGEGSITGCGVPTARGAATTVAAAADEQEFLAFRKGLAPDVRGDYNPPQVTGSIRRYASIVAERLVLQNGLPRPRSWPGAQRDLQAIEILSGGDPEMATTYLVGDRLAVGPAESQGAYSVFYIGDYETRRGYQPIYSEVRNYNKSGKAAPRLVDYLNWDGQEGQEVLVQVYGPQQSWYELIRQDGRGRWVKAWEAQPCGPAASTPAP